MADHDQSLAGNSDCPQIFEPIPQIVEMGIEIL
jgi:hypothetical protein